MPLREPYGYWPVYAAYPGFLGMGKVEKADRQEWKVYIDQLQALNQQLRKGSVDPETPEPMAPAVVGSAAQQKKARDVSQAIVNARQIARNLAAAAAARNDTSAYVRGTIPGYRDPTTLLPAVQPGNFVDTTVPDPVAATGPGVPSPVFLPAYTPAPMVVPAGFAPGGKVRDIARAPAMMDPTTPSIAASSGGMGKWIIGGAIVLGVGAVLLMRRRKNPRGGARRSRRRSSARRRR